ncbi:hypothetical protein V3C99_014533 [Haemonchus contortus]
MTYRISALILAIAVITISAAKSELKVDSLAIARSCCPHRAVSCCAETIENRLPLNCSLPLENLVSASNCIQTTMYGTNSMKGIQIEDIECCQVFADDFTDNSADCLNTCKRTLRTPSLRLVDKLHSIRNCRPNIKNYVCFRQCLSFLRSRNNSTKKFPYLAVCNLADRLSPNVLYIGPEVKD